MESSIGVVDKAKYFLACLTEVFPISLLDRKMRPAAPTKETHLLILVRNDIDVFPPLGVVLRAFVHDLTVVVDLQGIDYDDDQDDEEDEGGQGTHGRRDAPFLDLGLD